MGRSHPRGETIGVLAIARNVRAPTPCVSPATQGMRAMRL